MTDIFREVDEEVRAEKAADIWRRYGSLIVVLVVLLLGGVAGWRYYQHRAETASAESAAKFEAALDLSRAGKNSDARQALLQLAGDGTSGYAGLARFRAASELGVTDRQGAANAFDALAGDAQFDATLQDLAKLRAAGLLIDTVSGDELQKRIGALAQPGRPWRNAARELLGLARHRDGDVKAASGFFEQIALDAEATEQMRQRAQIMLGLVRGGVVPVD